jgi:hypothetical protein
MMSIEQIHAGDQTGRTLGDRLPIEVLRNLNLLDVYIRAPYENRGQLQVNTGPAVALLKRDIVEAVVAAVRGDVAAMIVSLRALEGNE